MPEMTGLEMLEKMREQQDLQAAVLVISGFGDAPKIKKAWSLGAFDFVDKPFDNQQLLSLIRNALEFGKEQARAWAQTHVGKLSSSAKKGAA